MFNGKKGEKIFTRTYIELYIFSKVILLPLQFLLFTVLSFAHLSANHDNPKATVSKLFEASTDL